MSTEFVFKISDYVDEGQIEGGKVLYLELKEALDKKCGILLDFTGDPMVTSGFLNESIGRLVLERGRFIITLKDGYRDPSQCNGVYHPFSLVHQVIENAEQQRKKQAEESKA